LLEGLGVELEDGRRWKCINFCKWMIDCDEKEGVLYPSEKLILFLLLFDF
jgi:hypothetical protein